MKGPTLKDKGMRSIVIKKGVFDRFVDIRKQLNTSKYGDTDARYTNSHVLEILMEAWFDSLPENNDGQKEQTVEPRFKR
tara:strand:- start:445 stop:681 length:237 start_codon:yes stop_codon:yes gene_type:complete